MSEILEIAKLILSSNVMPKTAFILMLPSLLESIEGIIEFIVISYVLIRYRHGIKNFILKLFRGD